MLIQVVVLRNIVESNPAPDSQYIHHTVVEETPLISYQASFTPDIGDVLRIDSKEYTIISREFTINANGIDLEVGSKIRCYLRNQA